MPKSLDKMLEFLSLKLLLRILFIVLVPSVALKALLITSNPESNNSEYTQYAMTYTIIATVIAIALVIYEWRFQREIVRELVAIVFGLASGLTVSLLIVLMLVAFFLPSSVVVDGSPLPLDEALTNAFYKVQQWIPLIILSCCYIAITVVLETKSDFRFLIPYIDFSARGTQEGGIILDSSAIIDGRITDLCDSRLISVPIVITDYVVRELQALADSKDKTKRMRGRRGLDIVSQLQKSDAVRIVLRETDIPSGIPVDDLLVLTAKEIHGRIVTTDFNLNKVCQIEGIPVINLHELASAIKPRIIPGDSLDLKIIRPGQEDNQGVGYLEDGTMVVVENAREFIEQTVTIIITGSIQTSAGRMIFGKIERQPDQDGNTEEEAK